VGKDRDESVLENSTFDIINVLDADSEDHFALIHMLSSVHTLEINSCEFFSCDGSSSSGVIFYELFKNMVILNSTFNSCFFGKNISAIQIRRFNYLFHYFFF
jgi:hypothetical protein